MYIYYNIKCKFVTLVLYQPTPKLLFKMKGMETQKEKSKPM